MLRNLPMIAIIWLLFANRNSFSVFFKSSGIEQIVIEALWTFLLSLKIMTDMKAKLHHSFSPFSQSPCYFLFDSRPPANESSLCNAWNIHSSKISPYRHYDFWIEILIFRKKFYFRIPKKVVQLSDETDNNTVLSEINRR